MLKRRQFLAAGLPALLLPAARSLHARQMRTFKRENVLGTSFELKVLASSEAASSHAEAAAMGEIRREDAILSSWRPDSEFSHWFRTSGEAVRVSPELFEVLSAFDAWRARTDGAIDAAAEVVTRAWSAGARLGRTPTADELARAVSAAGQPHWSLNGATCTATHLSDTPLAMNSFVKSYIMDRAVDAALSTPGISAAVMNIGGDLVIRGAWTEPVHVADPRSDEENSAPIARLLVADRAVATSGGYRRGFDIAGSHYSHIVDPRTGESASHILSATVIAPNPTEAGALATACCLLTPQESARLAAIIPGVDYHLITANGQRLSSAGWHHYEASAPRLIAAAKPEPVPAPAPQAADSTMQVGISLQIAQPAGFGKPPYVAVWVEDKDRFPIRTLALWYQKDRWLPELRNWYRDDRMRAMAEGRDIAASVASATRPPGKYTLKWDGKDNAGKPVQFGKYTVLIEAAREHGTYQIMRQEIDLNGKPQQFQIPGNQEIASAAIDYRPSAR